MAGLNKKKVTVRTKRGKVYQRSMNVRSTPKVSRSTGRLTVGKAIRKYGLGAFGLGAGTGASMMGGAMLGMHAGMHAGNRHNEPQLAGTGAGAGLLAGTALAIRGLRSKRVERANRDISKHGTTGARLALGAIAGIGHAATALGMMYAHEKLRSAQTDRIRERMNSREVARA